MASHPWPHGLDLVRSRVRNAQCLRSSAATLSRIPAAQRLILRARLASSSQVMRVRLSLFSRSLSLLQSWMRSSQVIGWTRRVRFCLEPLAISYEQLTRTRHAALCVELRIEPRRPRVLRREHEEALGVALAGQLGVALTGQLGVAGQEHRQPLLRRDH